MSRLLTAILAITFLAFIPVRTEGNTISGPEVKLVNDDMYVSFSLALSEKAVQELQEGMDKEFRLYADLFRVWKSWSDEFVLGKYSVRTLKSDPIKKEYVASSFDGQSLIEKRYRSFESMIGSALSVKDLKLTNIRELEPGQYFVRVTVESKLRKLPSFIGHILIFVQDNEFKIKKDSGPLTIEGHK